MNIVDSYTGFLHTSGNKILTSNNDQFIIKGINFGDNCWDNHTFNYNTYSDEDSYKELQDLGINTVRWLISYGYYATSDSSGNLSFVDKTESNYLQGFRWLDQNIEWGKKYGIKFILNLHVPYGNFMKANSTNTVFEDENINKNKQFLTYLATRYKDEEAVLGFGFFNEPFIPYKTDDNDTIDFYWQTVSEIIEAIRVVDVHNRPIFVERPYGYFNKPDSGYGYFGITNSFRVINYPNIVYEFHSYYPVEYTYQLYQYGNLNTTKAWGEEGFDKTYLSNIFNQFISWSNTNNVPLYLGEVGAICKLFSPEYNDKNFDYKAKEFMTDVLDILQENNLSYSLFDYHSQTFGLWMNTGYSKRKNTVDNGEYTIGKLNQVLWDLCVSKIKGGIPDSEKDFYNLLYQVIYDYLNELTIHLITR